MSGSPSLYRQYRKLALKVPEEKRIEALVALWVATEDWDRSVPFRKFALERIARVTGETV